MTSKCNCLSRNRYRWGHNAFHAALVLAIILFVVLNRISRDIAGGPHSTVMFEGYKAIRICGILTIVLAPAGFILLYFRIAGKALSMLYWCALSVAFGFSIISMVRCIVWLSMKETTRVEDMLSHAESVFQATQSFTEHLTYVERNYKCCGLLNFTDYPERIFNQPRPTQARVPDHCCRPNFRSKDCGRFLLYNDTRKYGDETKNTGITSDPISIVEDTCKYLDGGTDGVSDTEFSDYVFYSRNGTLQSRPELTRLSDAIKKKVCTTGPDFQDHVCYRNKEKGDLDAQLRWEWCFQLFFDTEKEGPINYEVFKMRETQSIWGDGCFSQVEEYVDQISKVILAFATFLFAILVMLLILYIHMYWDYREPEMKVRPLPFWCDPLPGEKNLPVGLGVRLDSNQPLALLEDHQIAALFNLPGVNQELEQKPSVEAPLATAKSLKAVSIRHKDKKLNLKSPPEQRKMSVDKATGTAGQLVSDSVTPPPPPPLVIEPDQELIAIRSRQEARKHTLQFEEPNSRRKH